MAGDAIDAPGGLSSPAPTLGPVSGAAAIRIRGLRVARGGRVVLPGIDLDVTAGSVTGLVGPSGSGKTTLMRAIVGVQVLAGGEVTVLGARAGSPVLRSRVAYVTQSGSVYPDLTARENVRYLARILGAESGQVARVLDLVDLTREADRPVAQLSGGQRRRVALAGALLGQPELLVLDEPTVGLDPLLRRELWSLFARLRDAGATLLVSTHVLDEAGRCDVVLLLREGQLLATTTADGLRRDTGTTDLDEAFVRLIERAPAGQAP
jgi:ABC-2 type transport system ATP-binding protein